jgi:superfamily I DNA and/or RNA helicase
LGFLTDERRVNVAITRPKDFLFLIGNRATLSVEKAYYNEKKGKWFPNVWHKLIKQIDANGGYYKIEELPDRFDYKNFAKCIENGPTFTE